MKRIFTMKYVVNKKIKKTSKKTFQASFLQLIYKVFNPFIWANGGIKNKSGMRVTDNFDSLMKMRVRFWVSQ